MEIWVDGKKIDEQRRHAFSYYTFLDANYNLAAGSHRVTVFSAGWDNLLESITFPLIVGGSSCGLPASPGLNVCSPIDNSTVNSPLLAWASGKTTGSVARMEVWVDGVKKYSTYGSNSLKSSLVLTSGNHSVVYFVVNTVGQKWSQTVHVTVP